MVVVGSAVGALLAGGDGDARRARTGTAVRPVPTTPTPPAATVAATRLPCRDRLTPAEPLRLWVAGDSIAWSVGTGLGTRAAATGVVAPVYESRVGSGLGSPGAFDWPQRIRQELSRLDPEVVVFVMGTNDWGLPQATPLDAAGRPAWRAAYAERVRAVADAVTAGGRTLYWVGPPVLRDPRQETGGKEVAAVIREVVADVPGAVFVDAHDLLDTDDGRYTPTVVVAGRALTVRTADGVHLTPEGAGFLGDALFARLDAQCALRARAVPGVTQPVVETQGSTTATPRTTTPTPATTGTSTPVTPTTGPPGPTGPPAPPASTTPTTPPGPTTPTGPPGPSTPTSAPG